jgi:hypothetical protein
VKLFIFSIFLSCVLLSCLNTSSAKAPEIEGGSVAITADSSQKPNSLEVKEQVLDIDEYNRRILALCHDSITKGWPAETPIPKNGAILPFKRVVAYYGNFYSKHMGILGSLPEEELIKNLKTEVDKWNKEDENTPAIPAIHYIAITAQSRPGKGGTYRLRMPENQILKAVELARKIGGISFLDIQVGHSTVHDEVPTLEQYLINEDVHLGLDPEWSMKDGTTPGRKIGTMDASDINFAIKYLTTLVKKHNLPPKILVVHRFTIGMITNSDQIKPTPEVQLVISMDGFGFPAKKVNSYKRAIYDFPVQFTGFKLFYKNDKLSKPYKVMTPKEVLELYPKPIYIQYQ